MNNKSFDLSKYGINVKNVYRNLSTARIYEEIIKNEKDSYIASNGAIRVISYEKTGRSPTDKRVVKENENEKNIWWGNVNIPINSKSFEINKERAINYLNSLDKLYVVDAFAGWDKDYMKKIRLVMSRPYHALFMKNMLIVPSEKDLENFDPDYIIFNAGVFPANKHTDGVGSSTSVSLNFKTKEFVILGTQYAGEMKKGVFTIMNYIMPKNNILSMHASANEGKDGDVAIFFGLSGTGKTTLSADPKRKLIGDDEHCWTDKGIFNIEGGCYAKCIDLTPKSEPEIYKAIRFGTVLENLVFDSKSRVIDYSDSSITENTRASYPLEYIENAKIPAIGSHPKNIIFLTCDAFGVLPPVAKLTPEQAMYHFMSGYTAKVAGTEMGVTEPEATFSACFGAAFLVWHPSKYAQLLAEQAKKHDVDIWLVNTGWTGGAYGKGSRMSLKYTRSIIDWILTNDKDGIDYIKDPVFGISIPENIDKVPKNILIPKNSWKSKKDYDLTAVKLAKLFIKNFKQFEKETSKAIIDAGPKI